MGYLDCLSDRAIDMAINWAIVGTGLHISNWMAPAIAKANDTKLVAICSRTPIKAKVIAERFGIENTYVSYDTLLKDKSVDVIYIATPNYLHAQMTIQAAQAGKHILVEKPMALSCIEGEAMVEACKIHGVKLGVGFHLRHHPAQIAAHKLISDNRLGNVFLLDARWISESPLRGGWWQNPVLAGDYIMMTRGVHLIDLIWFLLRKEPESVIMMTDGRRPTSTLEETAVATIQLGHDIFATLVVAHYATPPQNSFTVWGTNGFLQATNTIGFSTAGSLKIVTNEFSKELDYVACDPYLEEIEEFNRAVYQGSEPNPSGVDGLRVIRIVTALTESSLTRQFVNLPDT